jgi:murein DD-endopeptidase MepM/ murein hydrolase activator NlpD
MTARTHLRIVFSLAFAGTVTAGLFTAPAAADPLADARRDLAEAQVAADRAARRYTDALSEQARREAEIARLEAEIPRLQARADELRVLVEDRAVQLYRQGSSMPISRMVGARSVVEAARAINLTASSARHDRDLAAELTRTAEALVRDQDELRTRKAGQDALVAQLTDERAALDAALLAADAAVRNIEAVGFSQAALGDGAAAGRVATGAAVCPVAGATAFVNDWGAPRSGGRTHQGDDMFAAMGTPVVAVVDGVIRHDLDDLGGVGVWLEGTDGVGYYYAHLSAWEGDARAVTRGEVVGYVGDSGNARGASAHLHFGMRAPNGEMVNPFPTVRALCGA